MGCVSSKEEVTTARPVSAPARNTTVKPDVTAAAVVPVKPKVEVTEADRVMLQLKASKDELNRLKKRSEISLAKDREVAKQLYLAGDKDRAILALKKKKLSETQLQTAENMIFKTEERISGLEANTVLADVFKALEEGNKVLKQLNESLKVEDVERLLSEGDEQTEKIHEISRLFGTESNPEMDADVLAEFDALIAEEEGKKATTRTPAPIQKQVEGTTEDIEEGEEVITTEIPKVVKAEHQEAVPL